ncbi:hypothetical protein TGRUB_359610, partial [Toxoplasma gondii RUB]
MHRCARTEGKNCRTDLPGILGRRIPPTHRVRDLEKKGGTRGTYSFLLSRSAVHGSTYARLCPHQ